MTTPRNKLKRWLKDHPGMTLRKFAKEVGCTNSYICQLSKDDGAPWPSRDVAVAIAKATGGEVTPNDLAGLVVGLPVGSFEPRRSIAAGE